MKHSEIFLSKKYLFIRTLKFQTLGRSLTAIPPSSRIILHHQQIKILWSVKAFSVVQEERIDSSGVENCRKRIIKSNHVENHVENTSQIFKRRLQSGYFRFTRWYYGGCTGLRMIKKVRTIIKDGYLDM